jgi:hypothetical protein
MFSGDANSIFGRSVGSALGRDISPNNQQTWSERFQTLLVTRSIQLAGGNRRRAKYGIFGLFLLFLFFYAWMFQSYETSEHNRVVHYADTHSNNKKPSVPTLAPTSRTDQSNSGGGGSSSGGGGDIKIYYEPTAMPTLIHVTLSPSTGTETGTGGTGSDVNNMPTFSPTIASTVNNTNHNSSSSTTIPPVDTDKTKARPGESESMLSFWLSVGFSLMTWIIIIQVIRYLRRPFRARAQASLSQREQGQIELLNQLILFNSHPNAQGLATRLRLAMLNRDFTAEDYEMLSQLDEVTLGGNGSARPRRGASQGLINQLPLHKITQEELNAVTGSASGTGSASSSVSGSGSGGENCCNICLAPYEIGDDVRTVMCLHKFHKECIDPWLKVNAVCPICKYSILADEEEAQEGQFISSSYHVSQSLGTRE